MKRIKEFIKTAFGGVLSAEAIVDDGFLVHLIFVNIIVEYSNLKMDDLDG